MKMRDLQWRRRDRPREVFRRTRLLRKLQKKGLAHMYDLVMRRDPRWNARFAFAAAVEPVGLSPKRSPRKPRYKDVRKEPLKRRDWWELREAVLDDERNAG